MHRVSIKTNFIGYICVLCMLKYSDFIMDDDTAVIHLQIKVDGSWDAHLHNLMGPSLQSMGPTAKINGSQCLNIIANFYYFALLFVCIVLPLLRDPLLLDCV